MLSIQSYSDSVVVIMFINYTDLLFVSEVARSVLSYNLYSVKNIAGNVILSSRSCVILT